MQPSQRIIVPLDVPSLEIAVTLIDRLPQVEFWKVGLELFISAGPDILTALKARQKRVFLDLKLHDIPNTMARASRIAAQYGVDLLTVHAAAGKAALSSAQTAVLEAAQAAGVKPPQIVAVTVLTSIDGRSLAFDLKVPLELSDYVMQLGLLAKDCGLPGIVCSPHEASLMRRVLGADAILVCPGVRPKGSCSGDQRRIMTPREALQAGATYLVIGRPITEATDPPAAFERICEELG